ncbi:MAG TPA: hypothetical protein DCP28_13695 [Cytophagales bacterium]|nr:hypothetical protein [Cytophagales bacterium]
MSYYDPPQRPLRFLQWFCTSERIEEIEGDLFELFQERVELVGLRRARWWYLWWVLRSLRGFALKRNNKFWSITQNLMLFQHHLRIAGRSLRHNPRTTAVNVVGLAIGISAFLAISQILWVEYSYNRQVPEGDRIYRITSSFEGDFAMEIAGVPKPAAEYIRNQFNGLELAVPMYLESLKVALPDEAPFASFDRLEERNQVAWVGPEYFDLFQGYTWLAGDPKKAMEEPYQVVLTLEQAQTYFGIQTASALLNKTLLYSDTLAFTVTGIVQCPSYRNDFHFTEFLSLSSHKQIQDYAVGYGEDYWNNTSSNDQVWVKLRPDVSLASLQEQLVRLREHTTEITGDADFSPTYVEQALADIHFAEEMEIFPDARPAADLQSLVIMSGVAFALLLIAIFNFVNLETARSATKSKEVGVRKVLGGRRGDLMSRFLTDSLLIASLAVLLSVPLAHWGLTYFETYLPEPVALPLASLGFWGFLMALTLLVGLLAGSYPTWVVASFQPIKALKNRYNTAGSQGGSARLRRLLIGFQFTFSQLLIVGTLTVVFQLDYLMTKDLGFEDDGIVTVFTPWRGEAQDRKRLITALQQEANILDMSVQMNPFLREGWNRSFITYEQGGQVLSMDINANAADTSFLSFYELPLLAGKNYLANAPSDQVVVNEALAHAMGYDDVSGAVGAVLNKDQSNPYTVVGVIPDVHFQSLHNDIEPFMLRYTEKGRAIGLRIPMDDRMPSTMGRIEDLWKSVYPEIAFDPEFLDDTVARFYQNERQVSSLASVATVVAILISCLGLFGLISFTVVQRSKEMGIRKILGASMTNIGRLLSKEFMILTGISFLIATPIAYQLIQNWMSGFAYQASLGWWIYVLGGLLSMVIALMTISTKVWQASRANPIDSLRHE